jgi:hypothetical protein
MEDVDNIDCEVILVIIDIAKCLSTRTYENSSRYFGWPLQSRLQNDAEHGMKSGLRNGSLGDTKDAFSQLVHMHTANGDIGWLILSNGKRK